MDQALRDRIAIALGGLAILLVGGSVWLLLSGAGTVATPAVVPSFGTIASDLPVGSPSPPGQLVVDVEGGVLHPGIVVLPAGSRVADAIRGAGGYATDADLPAAATALNLAAPLADGAQVYVPILGMDTTEVGGGGGSTDGGLVNLNTAAAGALESLPGIGPVTAQKIIAARGEQPFTTLDELVDRKVMNRGQLDGIRDLVTL